MAGTVIHVHGQEKLRLRVPAGEVLGGRTALVISQADIEAQLRARLAELGGCIEWGREVTGVEQHPDGATTSFADGGTARCDWVVGSDGAGSRVRKSTGIRLVGDTGAERFLLADVQVELPVEQGFASMWVGTGGSLAALPLPGEARWRLMAPAPSGEPDDIPAVRVLELLISSLGDRVGSCVPRIRDVSWTSTFRVHRRLASAYRCGRVLLAGDAAHVHSPTGGQGMNTGIGDAENLAFKLALVVGGRAEPALLHSYEAERRPIAEAVVTSVGGVDKLLASRNPLVAFVREHLLYPAVNRPMIQQQIWRKASQLHISYRHGPLAPTTGRRVDGRRSGDRVPDFPCQRPDDGGDTRLHAELGGRGPS
ncbi:MAG: hypothetical protein GEV09_19755 [Pseudonocardiaceae bacterium]|nr:hypothetical protein [Pseudonocardiaceae bacterium]